MKAEMVAQIVAVVQAHYPTVQGIYLFGSQATAVTHVDSDLDIALLLTPEEARTAQNLTFSDCYWALSEAFADTAVDLINLRHEQSTILRFQIITTGELIYCGHKFAVDEFEMLTISYYQILNEERAGIMAAFLADGRAYDV